MNRFSAEMICLGVFITGILVAMFFSQVWYLFPPLIGVYLFLWHITRERRDLIPALLISGEIPCAAAWYTSPWLAWIIQVSVTGLFLIRVNIPDTRREWTAFITLYVVFALITLLSDQINHTPLPIVIIIIASVLVTMAILVSEYRLRREYSGEQS